VKRALLTLALVLPACNPPPSVSFGPPSHEMKAADYEKVQHRWRRHARIQSNVWDQALDASVTMLSPEMRAAGVAKVAEMRQLTAEQRQKLSEDQAIEGERFLDFVVNAQTSKWEWNDFSSPRSHWSFRLVDDRGRELNPVEVQPLGLKPESVEALYPPVTPFTRSWRVRFERAPEGQPVGADALGGAGTHWISLQIGGPLGATLKPGKPAIENPLRWTASRD
jgi:hypothetical protein